MDELRRVKSVSGNSFVTVERPSDLITYTGVELGTSNYTYQTGDVNTKEDRFSLAADFVGLVMKTHSAKLHVNQTESIRPT